MKILRFQSTNRMRSAKRSRLDLVIMFLFVWFFLFRMQFFLPVTTITMKAKCQEWFIFGAILGKRDCQREFFLKFFVYLTLSSFNFLLWTLFPEAGDHSQAKWNWQIFIELLAGNSVVFNFIFWSMWHIFRELFFSESTSYFSYFYATNKSLLWFISYRSYVVECLNVFFYDFVVQLCKCDI